MKIAFLGLGAMGSRMAARLAAAGHELTVWNRSAGRADAMEGGNIRVALNTADAASGADLVLSMVRDDDASSNVWLGGEGGALGAMMGSAIAIELSTVTRQWTSELTKAARKAGIAFVASPVAGTLPQAEAGELVMLAGSDDMAAIDTAMPALSTMGRSVVRLPSADHACLAKLTVNLLLAAQVTALAENRRALGRLAIEPDSVLEAALSTPVCSPATRAAATSMSNGAFMPAMFPVELMNKDMGYAAAAFGGPDEAPLLHVIKSVFGDAEAEGLGPEQMTAIVKLERWST
jgi:3-hydroxyisobutyrate dehydrogenase